jgi:hypothetical protein
MCFEASYELPAGGIDMASPVVERQLVNGWYEPEQSAGRSYRWATRHAAAVVRLAESSCGARLTYCLPPVASGVDVQMFPLGQQAPVWSKSIVWHDADWHEDSFPLRLAAGDYVVTFDAERAWSNADQRDQAFWPENRALGFAVSSFSFDAAA